jgi:hypothetical protein
VLDALGLMKLMAAAELFVLFDGSPLLALGVVFAAPLIVARVAQIAFAARCIDSYLEQFPRGTAG